MRFDEFLKFFISLQMRCNLSTSIGIVCLCGMFTLILLGLRFIRCINSLLTILERKSVTIRFQSSIIIYSYCSFFYKSFRYNSMHPFCILLNNQPSVDDILSAIKEYTECSSTECHAPYHLITPSSPSMSVSSILALWWAFITMLYIAHQSTIPSHATSIISQ